MANLLRKLCEGTISGEKQEMLTDIGVVDFHSHIGNILERDNAQVYKSTKFPIDMRTIGGNYGKFKAPGAITSTIIHTELVDNILKASGKKRNDSANLHTFNESMNDSFIASAVCLPIPPYQTLIDLIEVKELDERIITFTGVNFREKIDLDLLEKQFESDVKAGAKGLKIHPIIQGVAPDSKIIDDIIRLWSKDDLPIIFHTGVTEYSTKKNKNPHHKPEYGQIKYFIELSKNHPEAKIVIGHSGLFQVNEVIQYLAQYDNVVVDTSFQGKQKILELLQAFGNERLMFASDWPYGDRVPAVNVMYEALNGNETLIRKIMRENALYSMNMK